MKKTILLITLFNVVILANFTRTDQMITDKRTHLEWQDNSDVKINTKTWGEAINYCEKLTLGEKDNWRLPNINELYSIVNMYQKAPAVYPIFQNTPSKSFFSSTSQNYYQESAWSVNFFYGLVLGEKKEEKLYVRCVRDK